MGKYIVTYDLCKPQQKYVGLINCLKLYSACKLTESCWLLISPQPARKIGDTLIRYIDANDRLMVAEITGEAAWENLIASNLVIKDLLSR